MPEIHSEFEVNHTKIAGSANCPPLNEQPTTSRPNSYLGYIPVDYNQAVNVPTYIQQRIEPPTQRQTYVHENTNANEQKVEEHFVPIHQNHFDGENGNSKSNVLSPVPNLGERISIPIPQNPILQEQPIRHRSVVNDNQQEELRRIDQTKQMNQFATQIEELREKVEELVEQNQQLVQNLNQILPNKTAILVTHPVQNATTDEAEESTVNPWTSNFENCRF